MDRIRYWMLTAMAAVSLLLVLFNIVLQAGNRSLQAEISERNLYIQQSTQLEGIYQPLLRTLAELSVRHQDAELSALLAEQGIRISVNQAATQSAGAQNSGRVRAPAATASPEAEPTAANEELGASIEEPAASAEEPATATEEPSSD